MLLNFLQDGISNCMSAKALRRELSPNSEDESPATVKFIKMSCKYFTDGMVRSLENPRMLGNSLTPVDRPNSYCIQEVPSGCFLSHRPHHHCCVMLSWQGVVGGVLIVTPNNIMFDPHKSDPLVIEHGCEEYGLICPMEEVVSVALYDDVSRMKLKDALPS